MCGFLIANYYSIEIYLGGKGRRALTKALLNYLNNVVIIAFAEFENILSEAIKIARARGY